MRGGIIAWRTLRCVEASSRGQLLEPATDAREAIVQHLARAARPDAQMPLEPEMTPRHDEHILRLAQLCRDLLARPARERAVIAHERHRRRGRRRPRNQSLVLRHPRFRHRYVLAQDHARATVEPLPYVALDRHTRDRVRELVRPDRD